MRLRLGLFTKYCEVCGVKVENGADFVRFGKHFCSEEHASKYTAEVEQRRIATPVQEDNGCC